MLPRHLLTPTQAIHYLKPDVELINILLILRKHGYSKVRGIWKLFTSRSDSLLI
jgi:hypothetical protein